MGVEIADHPAAAVVVDEDGQAGAGVLRPVDADRDVAGRAGHGAVLGVDIGPLAEHLGDREIAGPGHRHGLFRDGRNLVFDRGPRLNFEEGLYLGVDGHVGHSVAGETECVAYGIACGP